MVVKFVDSGRHYEINTDGAVSNSIEIGKDENAGDYPTLNFESTWNGAEWE